MVLVPLEFVRADAALKFLIDDPETDITISVDFIPKSGDSSSVKVGVYDSLVYNSLWDFQ